MNLLQFSQIPRYKLVRQNAENGWGRSIIYTDLQAHDGGEWMRVSDVRNLVVGDRPRPDVAGLVEALEEIVKQYPNPDISHENFRVHACRHAETALASHRKQQQGGQS